MLLSLTCMLVNSLPQFKPNLVTLQKKKKNYFLFESLFVFFVTSTPFRLHTRAQLAASDVTRFFGSFQTRMFEGNTFLKFIENDNNNNYNIF
jgi:hypothetical protein